MCSRRVDPGGDGGGSSGESKDSDSQASLIYLDLHVWVNLARRRKAGPDWIALYEVLRREVERKSIQIVLSDTLYLELWNRQDDRSRTEVAAVMRDLSGYSTLLAYAPLQALEVRVAATWIRNGSPGELPRVPSSEVLGFGSGQAFGSRTGRFRLVESIASRGRAEGSAARVSRELVEQVARMPLDHWEWLNLAGPAGLYGFGGIELRPEHRLGHDYAANQEQIGRHLASHPEGTFAARYMTALHLMWLSDVLAATFTDEAIQGYFKGPEDGLALVASVPTLDVKIRVELWAHRNRNYKFSQHDRADVLGLSHAVPYCDVVWVDKHWTRMAVSSGVATDYGVTLIRTPRQLLDHLGYPE